MVGLTELMGLLFSKRYMLPYFVFCVCFVILFCLLLYNDPLGLLNKKLNIQRIELLLYTCKPIIIVNDRVCRIFGSDGGGWEEFCLLEYNAV
jgi:hypothetical protein